MSCGLMDTPNLYDPLPVLRSARVRITVRIFKRFWSFVLVPCSARKNAHSNRDVPNLVAVLETRGMLRRNPITCCVSFSCHMWPQHGTARFWALMFSGLIVLGTLFLPHVHCGVLVVRCAVARLPASSVAPTFWTHAESLPDRALARSILEKRRSMLIFLPKNKATLPFKRAPEPNGPCPEF